MTLFHHNLIQEDNMIGPHPFGTDITIKQLQTRFISLTQWEDRYRQLILLARDLPALPTEEKQTQHQLTGCENRVWLAHTLQADGTLHFYGDSEGRIVRGLLAILLTAVEGKPPRHILTNNPLHLFQQLGIEQQLSPSRTQGLHHLITAVQQTARLYCTDTPEC